MLLDEFTKAAHEAQGKARRHRQDQLSAYSEIVMRTSPHPGDGVRLFKLATDLGLSAEHVRADIDIAAKFRQLPKHDEVTLKAALAEQSVAKQRLDDEGGIEALQKVLSPIMRSETQKHFIAANQKVDAINRARNESKSLRSGRPTAFGVLT